VKKESVSKVERFNIKTDIIGTAAAGERSTEKKNTLAYFRFLQRRENG
jgi:hypothetical protein